MITDKLSLLLAEKQRRSALPDLLSALFLQQIDFINDPSTRKALFIPRRSGKTYAIAVYLLKECLSSPATKCLYFGLTSESGWNTIYLHMIEVLCKQFHIPTTINLTARTITFENKSYIKITGDDANDKQIDKALGSRYRLVVFDECQSIQHDLESWIVSKLSPAMVDLRGIIVCAGTASHLMGERYWYKITRNVDRVPGWSVHSWTPFDNPHMAEKVQEHFSEQLAINPSFEETPAYRQEWKCEWIVESNARIYKFDPKKNLLADGYLSSNEKWKYILGVDFGYEDSNGIVVGAFNHHDNRFYIVDSFKKNHLQLDDIANLIIKYRTLYNPIYIVGDSQNKIVVETLRMKYHIPIRGAKQAGKFAHITQMNSDFISERILVLPKNIELIKEWDDLIWDEKHRLLGAYVEAATKENHLADAALYIHNFSKHFLSKPEQFDDRPPTMQEAEKAFLKSKADHLTDNSASFYDYRQIDVFEYLQTYKRQ